MLFRDSPEQARFRAELRNFLDQELPSIEWDMRNDREEMDEDETVFTRQFRNKLAERGWLTLGWPKAFGGGGDFVMLGGMFAGHEEGGGKKVKKNGSQLIEFYGSSSNTAITKHYGGLSDYRSSEGKKVQLKYRGKIKDTVQNILGGLRSSCTYVGAPSLKQLSKCTTFVRVNQQYNDTFGQD